MGIHYVHDKQINGGSCNSTSTNMQNISNKITLNETKYINFLRTQTIGACFAAQAQDVWDLGPVSPVQ